MATQKDLKEYFATRREGFRRKFELASMGVDAAAIRTPRVIAPTYATAGDEMRVLCRAAQAHDPTMSDAQADAAAAQTRPELYARYARETTTQLAQPEPQRQPLMSAADEMHEFAIEETKTNPKLSLVDAYSLVAKTRPALDRRRRDESTLCRNGVTVAAQRDGTALALAGVKPTIEKRKPIAPPATTQPSARAEAERRINEEQNATGCSVGDAFSRVMNADPALWEAYRAQQVQAVFGIANQDVLRQAKG